MLTASIDAVESKGNINGKRENQNISINAFIIYYMKYVFAINKAYTVEQGIHFSKSKLQFINNYRLKNIYIM